MAYLFLSSISIPTHKRTIAMSNSESWGNYAHKNRRLGWGDTDQAAKNWYDQE